MYFFGEILLSYLTGQPCQGAWHLTAHANQERKRERKRKGVLFLEAVVDRANELAACVQAEYARKRCGILFLALLHVRADNT